MSNWAKDTRATIVPGLRYRDAPAAIEWLCRVFGFEKHLVVPGDNDTIAHAQLSFGNGMIMLGSVREDEHGRLIKQPDEIGGAETQCSYVIVTDADAVYESARNAGADVLFETIVIVTDADAVYESARNAGAEIVMEIADQDHGGRLFSCLDLEGHLWNIGTYDPWA